MWSAERNRQHRATGHQMMHSCWQASVSRTSVPYLQAPVKKNTMFRTSFLLLGLGLSILVNAQQDALATLTGGSGKWSLVGSAPASGTCNTGDAAYTFSAKQVVVKQCKGGEWKSSTEVLDTWSASGKSGIAFGGARYEVKSLPATAPACKGNACVRLTTVPDGKTDATRTIYLTQ